jgi:3-oxoacyl-[acyl-carrier-protein] synthase-3
MQNKITGSGSYIPTVVQKNIDFLTQTFFDEKESKIPTSNEIVVKKFKAITGIEERRYASDDLKCSDIGTIAAQKAIDDAGINPEELDYIIVGQNFGDIDSGTAQSDMVPSIASRIKFNLKIKNPNCVAYDVIFGCPGWLEGVIQANAFIKAGMASKCLIIGAETLSRVVDPFDRDSMIYSDGAGACVLEKSEVGSDGILSSATQSFTHDEAHFLYFGKSYNPSANQETKYIKMYGRKIYEFALNNVPLAMKTALDKSGIHIDDISKVLIHQANEKMDEAIVERFYKLYDMEMPKKVMPMSILKLGNSSVATIPTLFDLIVKNKLAGYQIDKGDVLLLASVGAGMNINAVVYRY